MTEVTLFLIASIALFSAGHWIAATVLLLIDLAHRGKNSR